MTEIITFRQFGEHIKELRKQKRLTQRELAAILEVDFSYISKIENGKIENVPSYNFLVSLANGLGVDCEELFDLVGYVDWGKFIAIVGVDGTGKTALALSLTSLLQAAGYTNALYVNDPGTTKLGEALRLVRHGIKDPLALALAHAAARRELCETVIRPHLKAGGIVIADRFSPCFFAYHTVPKPILVTLDNLACEGLKPSLIIQPFANYDTAKHRKAREPDFLAQRDYYRILSNYAAQRKERKATLGEWLSIDTEVQSIAHTSGFVFDFIDHLFLGKKGADLRQN